MNRTFRKPLYKRLEPVNAWRGGRIANSDLLTLAEAANEASKHAGEEITAADFLRAASRGEIALHAIVHAIAKVEKYDGGIYCNQGMPTENSIPKGAIPTLPLDACMQLANTGTASWRTFEGFDYDGDGDWCRFDIAWLEDGEPDFETVANDCRVTGYDVHALADQWLTASNPVSPIAPRTGQAQPHKRGQKWTDEELRELLSEKKSGKTDEEIATFHGVTRQLITAKVRDAESQFGSRRSTDLSLTAQAKRVAFGPIK